MSLTENRKVLAGKKIPVTFSICFPHLLRQRFKIVEVLLPEMRIVSCLCLHKSELISERCKFSWNFPIDP